MTKKIFFASMKRKRNRGKGMSDKMLVKKAEDFITSKWSGGSTTELYIYPPQSVYREGNFKCRISSATVEVEKSDFTSLPGVKRYLSIFSGELKMIHGEKEEVILEPFEVDCFDGGVPTVSYGKVVDFNLMLKNGAEGEMQAKEMQTEEEMILKPTESENLLAVYVKTGCIQIKDKEVREGELFVCEDWNEELKIKNAASKKTGVGICKVKL